MGQNTRQRAAHFDISERIIRLLKRRYEAGELEPKRPSPVDPPASRLLM